MNRSYYISEVQRLVNEKTTDELKKVIMKIARFVDRDTREEVLGILKQTSPPPEVTEAFDLLAEVEKLADAVEAGEYHVGWSEYEDYDYYSDSETLFDPNGLSERVEDLLKLSMDYVGLKKYEEAFKAFESLLSISVSDEYHDDITVSILFSNGHINLIEKEVYMSYAYAALMVLNGEERLDKLYEIFCENGFRLDISQIAALGSDEIPERNAFGKQWIDYLMGIELNREEHILIEAVLFDGGAQGLHEFALEYGVKYKTVYLALVKRYLAEKEYRKAVSFVVISKSNGLRQAKSIFPLYKSVSTTLTFSKIGVFDNKLPQISPDIWLSILFLYNITMR